MQRFVLLAVALLLMTACAFGAVNVMTVERPDVPAFVGNVPNEFIVILKEDAEVLDAVQSMATGSQDPFVAIPELEALNSLYAVVSVKKQFPRRDYKQAETAVQRRLARHYKVKFSNGELEEVMAAYAAANPVEEVQPIGMFTVTAVPNDPYYRDSPDPDFQHDQWHLWQDHHGINAEDAWDVQTGDATVVIGVLDSGVRYYHLDLGGNHSPWGPDNPQTDGNIWVNPNEIPGNGIDDDGNGYIDDVVGYDFFEEENGWPYTCIDDDCGGADNDPDDGVGHGTHVAGTIAAITNNGRMVAGVAGGWGDGTPDGAATGVKIMPLRIGYRAMLFGIIEVGIVRMDYAAEAMDYVSWMVEHGVNVAAINCSWGSSNSGGLADAVTNLLAHDVLIVHAAGNDNADDPDFLGTRDSVMNVAATDSLGNGADFTNYGAWVDVAAPGVDILSTYRNPDDPDPNANYIAVQSGTSMSAPHVVGIAALLESCKPELSAMEKFDLIVNNTTPYTDSRNLGSGIANAKLALDAANCTGQQCDVTSDFSASPTSGCAPLSVMFTDQSTGPVTSWEWDFGDGNTSTEQNPTHTYQTEGNYTVQLIVCSANCCDTTSKTNYISVDAAPVADFEGSPLSGDAPLTVSFTDLSTNTPTSWDWDFGDGNTSTEQNPTHTYQSAGTYTVALTATNSCGSDTETKTDYITVTCTAPVADFVGDPTSGVAPLDVSFTDQSTGNPTSWSWDFGDGGTSTVQNPTHTYQNAGTYTVTLTATNDCGSDTETKVDYITVQECQPPVADFEGSPLSGDAPLTVSFTDLSTNNPTGWDWDFGDGGTSTAQNPSHTYQNAGTYTVTLTASNSCGSDTKTKTDYITVTEPPQDIMYVQSIDVTRQTLFNYGRGVATVTIYDVNNNPVPDATVDGVFSGPSSDSKNGTTDSNGEVVFYSSIVANPSGEWCFEVTGVSKTGWTYDPAQNQVTKACESGPVFASGSGQDDVLNESGNQTEDGLQLSQNYPNPFNPTTEISFSLPQSSFVTVRVYNVAGQQVAILTEGMLQAGQHTVVWDSRDISGTPVSSGIYFYRLETDKETITKKMLLLK